MKNWQLYAIAAAAVLVGIKIDQMLGLSSSVVSALSNTQAAA
jgi:hypothetical protein